MSFELESSRATFYVDCYATWSNFRSEECTSFTLKPAFVMPHIWDKPITLYIQELADKLTPEFKSYNIIWAHLYFIICLRGAVYLRIGRSWCRHRNVLMWGVGKNKQKHSILTDLLFWWWHNSPVIRLHVGNHEAPGWQQGSCLGGSLLLYRSCTEVSPGLPVVVRIYGKRDRAALSYWALIVTSTSP